MKVHAYCSLIPPMNSEEFKRLKSSIEKKGLLVPIVLLGDEILDGRHRYQACNELGIRVDTVQYSGDDPLVYAISINETRRHLTQSQRAMIAANLANMKHGGNRKNKQTANFPLEKTQEEIAIQLNVSERNIRNAKKIQKAPEPVREALTSGVISLPAAQKVMDNVEPGLLEKVTPSELLKLSKSVSASPTIKREKAINLAKQLKHECEALAQFEPSDEIMLGFSDIDFWLSLTLKVRGNTK